MDSHLHFLLWLLYLYPENRLDFECSGLARIRIHSSNSWTTIVGWYRHTIDFKLNKKKRLHLLYNITTWSFFWSKQQQDWKAWFSEIMIQRNWPLFRRQDRVEPCKNWKLENYFLFLTIPSLFIGENLHPRDVGSCMHVDLHKLLVAD